MLLHRMQGSWVRAALRATAVAASAASAALAAGRLVTTASACPCPPSHPPTHPLPSTTTGPRRACAQR